MSGNKCAISDGCQRGQLTTTDAAAGLLPLLGCLLFTGGVTGCLNGQMMDDEQRYF